MVEVSKDVFFKAVGSLDVHPRPERMHCSWEISGRRVIGKTTPGYLCRDEAGNYTAQSRFFLVNAEGGAA